MKFKMISWGEGLMESWLFEKEFEKLTVTDALKEVAKSIKKAKQKHPLFDFGLVKLTRIQNGEEIEIPLNAL